MREAPAGFYQLLDAAPDAMLVVDQFGRVAALNLEAERWFGCTRAELLGSPASKIIPKRFHRLLHAERAHAAESLPDEPASITCLIKRRDGSEFPMELSRRSLGEGDDVQSLLTLRDRAAWSHDPAARSRNSEQARDILQSIGDSIITTDIRRSITFLNPVAERLTGWTMEEARGQLLDEVLPLVAESTREPIANTAARCIEAGRAIDLEDGVLLVRRDGTEVAIGDSAAPIRNRLGEIVGAVIVIQDESEKRRVGHRLSFEATHDVLTGLTNRREFERRMARVLEDSAVSKSEHVLLYLDLDRFKLVNDACGHEAGDALLRRLAPVFARYLRKRDTLARLGGDEFAVLLENCPLSEGARIANDLLDGIAQFEFDWSGRTFSVTASIGVMQLIMETRGIEAVLRTADDAAYAAKARGGNCVHQHQQHDVSIKQHQMLPRTPSIRAVEEAHFRLYGQAIVGLTPESSTRAHFEVLLRLPDPAGGLHDAAHFLPQAERYDLMPAIDRWVLQRTIALLAKWSHDNPGAEMPICSINLSASALADDTLMRVIEHELGKHAIPAATICFEIPESAALFDRRRTERFIAGAKASSCSVALEGMGSGVTALTYLKTLSVDFLKIGGKLIEGITHDPMSATIVSAIDQIGRSMSVATIANQVSTLAMLNRIRSTGIAYAQGRALTAPSPLTDTMGSLLIPSGAMAS